MTSPASLGRQLAAVAVVLCSLSGPAAAETQPLATFLQGADSKNFDLRQARSTAAQRRSEAHAALGKLLPSLDLSGKYTRNAYEVKFPFGAGGQELTIMPYNQLDAAATLVVPIVDVVNWATLKARRAQADAAAAGAVASRNSVAGAVVRHYFTLRGQEALLGSAERRFRVACDSLKLVRAKHEAGSSSTLDVARAESDVAQSEQDAASARLQLAVSRRQLETLTGVTPEPGGALGEVSLAEEAPLASWMAHVGPELPLVEQAEAQRRAARAASRAARWGYLPTLAAQGTERLTNANGLNGGRSSIWSAVGSLSWHFDIGQTGTERAQHHAAMAAVAASDSAERSAADALFVDHAQIAANIIKSRAARTQVRATELGWTWARERFAAGTITQLEVSQAQRDAFGAEATQIQADTDLLFYRAMLRLDAGMPPSTLQETP